jgi:hypothetical protein
VVQDPESLNSVLDFIYVDSKRISLYLAQFSQYGNLTTLVHSTSKKDEDRAKFGVSIGPRAFRGEAMSDTAETADTSLQKHYSTQWIAPLSLLEELQARDMIKRTLEDVQIGDIFILPGSLSLFDTSMWAKVWDVVAAQHDAKPRRDQGSRHPRRSTSDRGLARSATNPSQPVDATGLRIIGALEQLAFLNFQSKGRRFWSLAESGCIVGGSTGLALKCGATIPGTWHMVAVLDAMPETESGDSQWLTRICGSESNA